MSARLSISLDSHPLAVGILIATWTAPRTTRHRTVDRYRSYLQRLGKAILLGLELLVAADIIRTVAVRPTLETAGVLAIIVLIRTALRFSLEVELEGLAMGANTGREHCPTTYVVNNICILHVWRIEDDRR